MKNKTMSVQTTKPVGIWIRVSTKDQAQGDSPEHHEQRGRLYAGAQGYAVKDVYRLEAVSGKSVMEHPETKRMLADVRSGRIAGLIFSKLARLARNTRELLDFADIFREYDAALISLRESLDTGTPAGKFFYTVIGALAEWERGEIAERVAASVPIRAKLGKPLGGVGVFGYEWKEGKLVPHPTEAPVRKLIYELYAEHRRKKTVANILNEQGYRTRRGNKFSAKVLEDLIRDTTAKGERRANYSTRRANGKYERKAKEEWFIHAVKPIVSKELWERCNSILMSQKRGTKVPGPRPQHLFGGVVRCSCGRKMYARQSTGKYSCDTCGTKIPAADLEAIYHTQLEGFLLSDSDLSEYFDRADESIAEKERLLLTQGDELGRLKKEIDHLFELSFKGELPEGGFGVRYAALEGRQKQIEGELVSIQAEIDVAKIVKVNRDYALTEARSLHARWPQLTYEDKKQIVQAITDEIVVGKDEVEIHLEYLPASGGKAVEKGTYEVGSPLG